MREFQPSPPPPHKNLMWQLPLRQRASRQLTESHIWVHLVEGFQGLSGCKLQVCLHRQTREAARQGRPFSEQATRSLKRVPQIMNGPPQKCNRRGLTTLPSLTLVYTGFWVPLASKFHFQLLSPWKGCQMLETWHYQRLCGLLLAVYA